MHVLSDAVALKNFGIQGYISGAQENAGLF